jgi:hypothetical protein
MKPIFTPAEQDFITWGRQEQPQADRAAVLHMVNDLSEHCDEYTAARMPYPPVLAALAAIFVVNCRDAKQDPQVVFSALYKAQEGGHRMPPKEFA